jgi:hypothetical protein
LYYWWLDLKREQNTRTQTRRLAFGDLASDPLKILERLIILWQDVDRIFDCDRTHALQPPPDFYVEIIRLGESGGLTRATDLSRASAMDPVLTRGRYSWICAKAAELTAAASALDRIQ